MTQTKSETSDPIANARTVEIELEDTDTASLTEKIEALLLSTDRPLNEAKLAGLLEISGEGASSKVKEAVEQLNEQYEKTSRSFRAQRVAGGWQLLTLAEFGPLLANLHRDKGQSKLSPAALETLAITAYRQPILRAEIEAIRGVGAGEVLRGLMERRLVKIVGRAEELGRPMLYGTTTQFLKLFGIASTEDLPEVQGLPEVKPKPKRKPKPKPEVQISESDEAANADTPKSNDEPQEDIESDS